MKLVIRRKCYDYNVDDDQHSITLLSRVLDVTESTRDDATSRAFRAAVNPNGFPLSLNFLTCCVIFVIFRESQVVM